MESKYFNEKYKDYLEDRFYGLAIDDPDVTVFLESIFDNVLIKIPGFKYLQIKMKWGKAKCYLNLNEPAMKELIENKINE